MSEKVVVYPEKMQLIRDYSRQIRWHKRNLRTITAKLNAEEYEIFKAICKARRTSPYAVMCRLARAYIHNAISGLYVRKDKDRA